MTSIPQPAFRNPQSSAPAERLVAFERWLYREMAQRLEWPEDRAAREKQIGQCRSFVMGAVGDLERHGFLFQPRELAILIREKLDAIGRLQKAGKVENLYPYFRAVWQTWVRCEADQLRERAKLCGAHIDSVMANMLRGVILPPVSIPEIVSQSLREQAAAVRRKMKAGKMKAE